MTIRARTGGAPRASSPALDALADLAASVPDGASCYFGGAVLRAKPIAFARALVDAGRRGIEAVSFAGSLEIDLLAGGGALARVRTAYAGLGPFGPAPRLEAAVAAGSVEAVEMTEWTLLQGLRAAAMGLPFLPTRAGRGSEVVAALGLAEVGDPYGGGSYLAVPPLRPDVAVIHAWRASPEGDVQAAWPPQHLADVDVLAARAARRVIVTAEHVVPRAELAASPQRTVLFGFEVDAVLEVSGGAWPTASPPDYGEDDEALRRYVAAGGDPAELAGAGAPAAGVSP